MNELRSSDRKSPPRVIIATGHWPDYRGGVTRTLHYLSDAWDNGADAPSYRIVPTRGPNGLLSGAFFMIRAMLVIGWAFVLGRADVIHITICSRGSTVRKAIIAGMAWAMRKPYILHLRSGEYPVFFRSLPSPFKSVVRFVFRRATRVLVLGAVWRDFVRDEIGVDPDRLTIMYNAVPGPAAIDRAEAREPCRLLFLGNLWDKKGVPELLQALSSDRVRPLAWTAVFAGQGEIERFAKSAADLGLGERIEFPGYVSPEAVVSFLRSADVLVLPSHFEGLPTSVLEAMAYGLAIVATTVGAIPEAVEDGVSGLLVPPGDAEALADAIARVIEDAKLRQSLSQSGRKRFDQLFDIRRYASNLTALYRECAAGGAMRSPRRSDSGNAGEMIPERVRQATVVALRPRPTRHDPRNTDMNAQAFLITIDTEGDDLWSKPQKIETRNTLFLPRFQALCERHGFKPTYLTNYEMAIDDGFIEFAKDVIDRGAGEVGMHLHAWNSPPLRPLTEDDFKFHPYLIEYPEPVMRDKIAFMTDLLEDRLGVKMISHRAGRWSFDETYARLLVEHGYRVDCSVTPLHSWKSTLGDPSGPGGTDFSRFPNSAYFIDPDDISRPGSSPLLEIPMTIDRNSPRFTGWAYRLPTVGRVARRLRPRIAWLRPNGRNLHSMLGIVRRAAAERRPYLEFMLHSSEFMPGGSPTFRTERDIETLYHHMETLFAAASRSHPGMTLNGFYQLQSAAHRPEDPNDAAPLAPAVTS